MDKFYVYLLSNQHHTVFYTGFTNDVARRVREHKDQIRKSFTQKYNVCKLLYFEVLDSADEAKYREKQLKRYPRAYKFNLINSINPQWRDLYKDFQ